MIPEGERPVMEVVWENIERYRKEKEMSIAQLCKKARYQSSSYHKNKNSKAQMLPNTIQKFAGVLGVKTIDLYDDWSD